MVTELVLVINIPNNIEINAAKGIKTEIFDDELAVILDSSNLP